MINQKILCIHGRRLANVLADADLDMPVTASLVHCNVSNDERERWLAQGVIYAGEDTQTHLPGYFSNVDALSGQVRKGPECEVDEISVSFGVGGEDD